MMAVRWTSAEQTTIYDDAIGATIPAIAGNRHYADILASGVEILPHVEGGPTIEDVRNEAQRRIMALVGATSLDACVFKQLNALMRATELTNIGQANWTPEQAAEAAALQGMEDAIKAIRAASNAMEGNPPADYQDNANWPS